MRAHLYEDTTAEHETIAALTQQQRVLYQRLLDATSPETRSLLANSADRHLNDMLALSPQGHLKDLPVPVFLLHGEADNIIPSAETLWMASELKEESLQAALISPLLSHVDMAKSPALWDEWKMVHFMAQVLRLALQ